MTKLEILRLAYDGALAAWDLQRQRYEDYPSELSQYKKHKAWEKLEEIHKMLLEEERK